MACIAITLAPCRAGADPAVVGQWSGLYQWPVVAAHLAVMPNGCIVSWQGSQNQGVGTQAAVVAIPAGGTPSAAMSLPIATDNLYGSAHVFLPDGDLMILGGTFGGSYNGTPFVNLVGNLTNAFSHGTNMNFARFYPQALTLANGATLALGGTTFPNSVKTVTLIPEISGDEGKTWHELSSAPVTSPTDAHVNQYSRIHNAPNGQVFFSSPGLMSYYLNTNGTGGWTPVAASHQVGIGIIGRTFGTSVMYDSGKVLMAGGGEIPTASAETIDLTVASPSWTLTAPMNYVRDWQQGTLLADGTVLITGGNSARNDNPANAVLAAETWNPATGQWTVMASMSHARQEFSTAALLPDGRVLSSGGASRCLASQVCIPSYLDADFFSPPYLFKGPRPTIARAPASVAYGQQFTIQTPDAASIELVTMIGLGSVTGAFNVGQAIARPGFTIGSGALSITAPSANGSVPPGYYLTFIVNGAGVPSVASTIQIY